MEKETVKLLRDYFSNMARNSYSEYQMGSSLEEDIVEALNKELTTYRIVIADWDNSTFYVQKSCYGDERQKGELTWNKTGRVIEFNTEYDAKKFISKIRFKKKVNEEMVG